MNNYPEYAQIKDKKYKINTDYKIAIKCNEIAESDIPDEERALAIIYLLFGDEGLKDNNNWNELSEISTKFLSCGKEVKKSNEEADISFKQDWGYIQASFFSDYNIDLTKQSMHWWMFYDLMCGLTEKCVLNRIRFVRDFDISQIKDPKEKEKWIKQKEQVAIKKEKTSEQKRLDKLFENLIQKGE